MSSSYDSSDSDDDASRNENVHGRAFEYDEFLSVNFARFSSLLISYMSGLLLRERLSPSH